MDCSACECARFAGVVGGIAQRAGTRGDRLRVPRSRVSKNVSKFAAKPLQSNTGQGFQLAMRLPLPHQLPVSGGPAQSGASPELRIPAGFFVSGCLTRSSRSKVDVGASLGGITHVDGCGTPPIATCANSIGIRRTRTLDRSLADGAKCLRLKHRFAGLGKRLVLGVYPEARAGLDGPVFVERKRRRAMPRGPRATVSFFLDGIVNRHCADSTVLDPVGIRAVGNRYAVVVDPPFQKRQFPVALLPDVVVASGPHLT